LILTSQSIKEIKHVNQSIATMKSAAVLASLVASAAAFAPASTTVRSSTSLKEFAKGYLGGDGPEPMFIGATGSKNFDPAGFCEVRSCKSVEFD
jgi:hypothetical protein